MRDGFADFTKAVGLGCSCHQPSRIYEIAPIHCVQPSLVFLSPSPSSARDSKCVPGERAKPLTLSASFRRMTRMHESVSSRMRVLSFVFVALTGLALFAVRLSGPPNLMTDDQERPAAHVLDALRNGHWICQCDWTGKVASKPPMYTWLAALTTLPFERINRFSLTLPSALATVVVGLIVLTVGRARFGWSAGFLAAMAYLLSPAAAKQVVLVRTDGLFTLMVTLTALAAYRAWTRGRGWTWFWLAAALATLTKGPLGVILGAAGLLAAIWEKRTGRRAGLHGSSTAGIALYLLIAAGWFALAYAQIGHALVDKMITSELLGHITTAHARRMWPGQSFYKSPLYFLMRLAPWSLFTCSALWRVWKHPATDDTQRRFERFVVCWFLGGLTIFSLAASQRSDRLFPLLPAAALLAGRELARLIGDRSRRAVIIGSAAAAVVFLGAVAYKYNFIARGEPGMLETIGMRQLAQEVRARAGDDVPLVYLDSPFALQFYLNTMRPQVSFAKAVQLLRGSAPVAVAVHDFTALQNNLGADAPALYELARWPASGEPFVRIVSNHPDLRK